MFVPIVRRIASTATVIALLAICSTASAELPGLDEVPEMEKTGAKDAAVIVGIGDYAFLPDIAGVGESVSNWERHFVDGIGVPSRRVFTLTGSDAVRERITSVARKARKSVESGGRLWFVYIGHGAPTRDGDDGVLVGADAQSTPSVLMSRSIRRSELVRELEQGEQSETFVMIDACFSGRARGDAALAEGTMPTVPTEVEDGRTRDSTVVVTAAAAHQFAGSLPDRDQPAFSYLMLGALRGWADEGDGEVTTGEAVRWVEQQMRHLEHEQTPTLLGSGDSVLTRGVDESGVDVAAALRGTSQPESPGAEPGAGDRVAPGRKTSRNPANAGGDVVGGGGGGAAAEAVERYVFVTMGDWSLRDREADTAYKGAELYRELGKDDLADEYESALAARRRNRWIGLGTAGAGLLGTTAGAIWWGVAANRDYEYDECTQLEREGAPDPVVRNCNVTKQRNDPKPPLRNSRILTAAGAGLAVAGGIFYLVTGVGNVHPVDRARLQKLVDERNETLDGDESEGASSSEREGTSRRGPTPDSASDGPVWGMAVVPTPSGASARLQVRW